MEACSLDAVFGVRNRPQPSATVRNRPQQFATVPNHSVCNCSKPFETVRNRLQPSSCDRRGRKLLCLWEGLQKRSSLEVSSVVSLRFAWHERRSVTFGRVWSCVENRWTWQAQYFCVVFRTCVVFFVAGAALWTCPSSCFVAGAALQSCVFFANRIVRAARSGDKGEIPWQARHFVSCDERWGSLVRNIDFEVANCWILLKTPRKTSIFNLPSGKIGRSLARNARFDASTHVCRFVSLASPCLWGKLQNLSSSKRPNCPNWGKSHCEASTS